MMSEKLLHADDKSRLFQLYLLSFMRVDPVALSKALRQLQSDEAELKAIERSMKGRAYQAIGGPDAGFYREMLGQPVLEESIDNNTLPAVFHDSIALHYSLPLWPDLDLVVNVLPDGGTFDTGFRRSNTVKAPPLNSFSDLGPWRFVKEEVDARFGSPQFGDAWDNWEEVYYTIPGSAGGRPQRCFVLFDFNLLQSAETEGG
jgi:hypothetical protein